MPQSLNSRAINGLTAIVLLAVLPGAGMAAGGIECAPDQAIFVLGRDQARAISFQVELADDAAERAQGLMFREKLPAGQGMLFAYEDPQPVAFWMKNTLIPLDMIFMDAGGIVRHIHAQARPHDETPIPGAVTGDPDPARQFVLEIAGGEASRLGLTPGDVMAHPAVAQEKAALPCG